MLGKGHRKAFAKPEQKKNVKGYEEREIRSSLSISDLKEDKLSDSGREDKKFHKFMFFGVKKDL